MYIAPTLFATLFLVSSLWGQVEEVDIIIGDSIQIIKTHQPPFAPTQVTFVESFTIPDPVDASIDSIRVNEQGNALLAYIKLKLNETAVAGESYQKNVTLLYLAGQSSAAYEHKFIVLAKSVTPVTDSQSSSLATLFQNYPNPVSGNTTIEFFIPERQHVELVLYNQFGQAVKTFLDASQLAGYHEVNLDCSGLPAGQYFYKMRTASYSISKQLMVIK